MNSQGRGGKSEQCVASQKPRKEGVSQNREEMRVPSAAC